MNLETAISLYATRTVDIQAVVRKEGNRWCVRSQKGKSLGCYGSEGEANTRLRQVEYFKRVKAAGFT